MNNIIFKKNNDTYVIAEAGLNHNGSIEIAKQLIDLAAEAGADAVKFQKRTVNILATKDVLDKRDDRFPEFGKTYRQIREHLEFSLEEYIDLKNYSEKLKLDFIVTAFDIDAFDFLEKVGVKFFKLASHSLTNIDLLEYLSKKNKPTILSTGMAELEEIDSAVNIFKSKKAPLALMHCVSAYPTPLEDCNIAMIDKIRDRYNLVTGYSGHEIGFLPTLVAVSRGAEIIERHYTLDNKMNGFDHKMSLEPAEFKLMIKNIRFINKIVGDGRKSVSETELITRNKYHVSMVSARNIEKGALLSKDMIVYRNPGTGIPKKHEDIILGKKAINNITEDQLLSIDMFE